MRNKVMIQRYLKYLACALAVFAVSSCSDTDVLEPDVEVDNTPGSIAIAIDSNSHLTSRTSVVDPDDNLRGKQHVTRVQLYIFEVLTDGDCECVATEDIKWHHLTGALEGLDTRLKKYTTVYQGYESGKQYKFIAFGFDDTFKGSEANPEFLGKNSVEAFGAPNSIIQVKDKLNTNNFFSLRNDKSSNILNHSEVFAGTQTYTAEELKNGSSSSRTIELYRRVAGVVGYFTKSPKSIDGMDVKSVVLRMCRNQYTQTYFLPKYDADKYFSPEAVPDRDYKDFIVSSSTETDADIISKYDVTDNNQGDFVMSAYLLPMNGSDDTGISTMCLDFLDESGRTIGRRKILYSADAAIGSRSGTGIIDDDGDNPAYHYPIRSNHFYKMGERNKPIDLSGSTSYILIQIDPVWDEYYGGNLDNDNSIPGLGLDKDWGEHEGGKLD